MAGFDTKSSVARLPPTRKLMLLTNNEIISELSYAYLHAVASRAGMSCSTGTRHEDNTGLDARVTIREDFGPEYKIKNLTIHFQLKATTKQPPDDGDNLSYFFQGTKRYNRLRETGFFPPVFLVVLYLPGDPGEWLSLDDEELVLRRCAYWVSLRQAPPTTNTSGCTIHLPRRQRFDPAGLRDLARRCAAQEEINYHG